MHFCPSIVEIQIQNKSENIYRCNAATAPGMAASSMCMVPLRSIRTALSLDIVAIPYPQVSRRDGIRKDGSAVI